MYNFSLENLISVDNAALCILLLLVGSYMLRRESRRPRPARPDCPKMCAEAHDMITVGPRSGGFLFLGAQMGTKFLQIIVWFPWIMLL